MEGQNQQNQQNQQTQIDVEKIKSDAMSEFLESIGVESEDVLKGIVTKHNETENANKTDLQKAQDALNKTTRELVSERNARMIAEAKVAAIQLGAKPELVDDLVTIAMAKVTKDKDINAVIADIKAGATSSVYFASDEKNNEQRNRNITNIVSKNQQQQKNQNQSQNQQQQDYDGSIAQRLMSRRKAVKPHYFS